MTSRRIPTITARPVRQPRQIVMVIPCGSEKLNRVAAARDLYTGSTFRMALAAAQNEIDGVDGMILILSAEHGLISLDARVAPYNTKMGQAGSITSHEVAAQALAHGIEAGRSDVYGMLPCAYFKVLDKALRTIDVTPAPVYEATSGIGDQRHVCAVVAG